MHPNTIHPACPTRGAPSARWSPARHASRPPWHTGLVALVFLAMGVARAQPAAPAPEERAPPAIRLPAQLDLPRLIDLTAERLGVAMEYDPGVVKGTIAQRVPGALDDAALWSWTHQVLASHGYTTVRPPGAPGFAVVRLADAAGLARVEPLGFAGQPAARPEDQPPPPRAELPIAHPRAGFETQLVRARHRPARELADAVRPLLTKGSGAATELAPIEPGDAGALLLADRTARLDHALGVIARLDSPRAPYEIEEVPVEHSPASAVASLAASLGVSSGTPAGASGGVGSSPTPTAPRPGEAWLPGTISAAPGDRSVLIVAPRSSMGAWRALVARLDVPRGLETRAYVAGVVAPDELARAIDASLLTERDRAAGARATPDSGAGLVHVVAGAALHERVAELVERLEASGNRPTSSRTFVLTNRPVRDVLRSLQALASSGALDAYDQGSHADVVPAGASDHPLLPDGAAFGGRRRDGSVTLDRSGRDRAARDGAGRDHGAPFQRDASPGVRLAADEPTNTLIAVGDSRVLARVEALVGALDTRQAQVMLEVLQVSLSEAQSRSLGVELERQEGLGSATLRLASLFGLSTPSDGPGGRTRAAPDTSGFNGVVLDPGEYSIVVKALEGVTRGRSSSVARVLWPTTRAPRSHRPSSSPSRPASRRARRRRHRSAGSRTPARGSPSSRTSPRATTWCSSTRCR